MHSHTHKKKNKRKTPNRTLKQSRTLRTKPRSIPRRTTHSLSLSPLNGNSRERSQQEKGREGEAGSQEDEQLDLVVAIARPAPDGRRQAVGPVLQAEQQTNVERTQVELETSNVYQLLIVFYCGPLMGLCLVAGRSRHNCKE